jgi:polysaccharide pyruvyl transferase WcaK-like protein
MKNIKKILLLDTSIVSENIGDFIIMDAVKKNIYKLLPHSMFFHAPTHEYINQATYTIAKECDHIFLGGTNLLSSQMNKYNQWKINLKDSLYLRNVTLMGVGWWQYQNKPNAYTSYLFKKVLNPHTLHSVRDSYTESMLKSIGIHNVINTSCPTMWGLSSEHCEAIPTTKSPNVIFTLTDYNKNPTLDSAFISTLKSEYQRLFYWPQGIGDLEYFRTLPQTEGIEVVAPSLHAYDALLESQQDLDFVGTRLHAGVRALQYKRRTIIIGIDNRALEKSKDFNLKVIARENQTEQLHSAIQNPFETKIHLPLNAIEQWKSQFQ